MNCSVVPVLKLGLAGVTAMEERVFAAAVTVRVAEPVTPLSEAEMVVVPAATAVARPEVLTVAVAVLEEAHVAVALTLAVEPSL